jgi:hypothetical protein
MINKSFKLISLVVLLAGFVILGLSFKYAPYTNEQEYNDKYFALKGDKITKQFYELRDEYLTPKFDFENYGISLILTGSILSLLAHIGFDKLRTPKKKSVLILIGALAALLSISGYVGQLHLEMMRGSYPHWADSLGIPLAAVPGFILLSLIWIGLNLLGIRGEFKTYVPVFPLSLRHVNYWYLIILLITILLTVFVIVTGDFWQVISGFLWSYFYLSIMLGIKQANIEKILNNFKSG